MDAADVFVVVDALQDWISEAGSECIVWCTFAPAARLVEIGAGDFTLWSSETDSPEDMTADYCKRQLVKQIGEVAGKLIGHTDE